MLVLVYFHGGVFYIGSPFSEGDSVYKARVATKAHVIALSLKYILYPNSAAPDSYNDARAFLKWVVAHKFEAHLPESNHG